VGVYIREIYWWFHPSLAFVIINSNDMESKIPLSQKYNPSLYHKQFRSMKVNLFSG
jgi:hypothetical protein